MKDRAIDSADVWVKTDGSVVTLGGPQKTNAEPRRPARAVEGVQSVKNEIKVD